MGDRCEFEWGPEAGVPAGEEGGHVVDSETLEAAGGPSCVVCFRLCLGLKRPRDLGSGDADRMVVSNDVWPGGVLSFVTRCHLASQPTRGQGTVSVWDAVSRPRFR